ncbi:MAG: quinolinate synthase NadA [Ruminococcus sp.]|nr:quinolinate synthase NadA [Ruminococcus sp.]
MTIREIQDEIIRLKKNTNTSVLVHSYQNRDIVEVADYVGDSYKLSVDAKNIDADNILFCGVHFMAETAKILAPSKRVFLANRLAGCSMAEQMDAELISRIKAEEPDRAVVAYVNTTAKLKAVCDVCVTSSSAVKIVKAMENDKILFIPDCNLGGFVQKNVPEKDIKLLHGGCPVHSAVTVDDLMNAKKLHPEALVLVHPECIPDVTAMADYAGSTSGIMDFAKNSDCKEFIIGTEISIVEHLMFECPDKKFYPLSQKIVCRDMKLTSIMDVYNSLKGIENGEAFEIVMSDEEISASRKCIDEMIRLGG